MPFDNRVSGPFNKWPNRLPPFYREKTLARLLPPQDQILKLSRSQAISLDREVEELKKYISQEPIRYFVPSEGGQWDFMTTFDTPMTGIRVNAFFAGNKSGKTTGSVLLAGEMMEGHALWSSGGRTRLETKTPSRGCFFAEDFSSHDETVLSHYFTWIPRRLIKRVIHNSSGYTVAIEHRNGSIAHLRTYDQGYAKPEGKDYDWVAFDEPPPRDIYTAAMRGIVATGGVMWIAATLLKEQWLFDELEHPFVRGHTASSYDNGWVDQRALSDFDTTLTDDERTIRIYGRPTTLSGVIYNDFKPIPPYVVQDVETWDPGTQDSWPVVMGVDPHERKPIHILWGYLTPTNGIVFFDWALIQTGPLEDIFAAIDRKEREHDARTRIVVIDPNRGAATQMGGSSWIEEFEGHGFDVLKGNDDMRVGHATTREFFRVDKESGEPRVRFLDTCRGKLGPIHQLTRYAWDDWSRGMKMERDQKEKPREKNKDFPDILRYICMAMRSGEISYDLFQRDFTVPLEYAGRRQAGRIY